jgi:alpha-galactosidase
MPKIVFIGAGSLGFTRDLVRDLMTFELLKESEIALVDIDEQRLKFSKQASEKIINAADSKAKITASTDRRELLKNADAVLITILVGSTNVWQDDILIPKEFGIDINVGDTRGPSGILRGLRTIPTMLDICKDIEELCPNAIVLNYTNPMAILCQSMQRITDLKITGLCHSVQGTAEMLARWCNVPYKELNYVCAGINHMAWYLKLEHQGENLYPKIKQLVTSKEDIYNEEQVRNEMFLAMDYYVTESSGHNSEYNWWFRKRPDLIEKYCTTGTGWNPGLHAFILNEYKDTEKTWQDDFKKWLDEDEVSLGRGEEYAANIINAYLGGELYEFNGNVPNTNLITNLPENACVEVPVLASPKGFAPIHVGDLPQQCAVLTGLSAQTEKMAVDAWLTGDAKLVYQAIAHDPLTAAKLSLVEIKEMVQKMLKRNREYLPQFKFIDF